MNDTRDDLERQLAAMFDAQDRALPVPDREWSGSNDLWPLASHNRPKRPYIAVGIAAAVVIILAATVPLARRNDSVKTGQSGPAGHAPAVVTPAFHAQTRQVSLSAGVSIEVGGTSFVTASPVQVHSAPGMWNSYTTLELTWMEHGVEMRVDMYFTSDGHQWWSDEIRTYDGRKQGEWITYKGDFFRSALGTPFVGDLDATASDHGVTGHLRLSDLHVEAFLRPAACLTPNSPYALEPGQSDVDIQVAPNSSYVLSATLLDTAACVPVANPDAFTYQWTSASPAAVTVTPAGLQGDLKAVAPGASTVHVAALDTTGTVVAAADVPVTVTR